MNQKGGAAGAPDTFRGYLNEGGLYAERIGAHLPGYPDDTWTTGSPLTGVSQAGINFYRTSFELVCSSIHVCTNLELQRFIEYPRWIRRSCTAFIHTERHNVQF